MTVWWARSRWSHANTESVDRWSDNDLRLQLSSLRTRPQARRTSAPRNPDTAPAMRPASIPKTPAVSAKLQHNEPARPATRTATAANTHRPSAWSAARSPMSTPQARQTRRTPSRKSARRYPWESGRRCTSRNGAAATALRRRVRRRARIDISCLRTRKPPLQTRAQGRPFQLTAEAPRRAAPDRCAAERKSPIPTPGAAVPTRMLDELALVDWLAPCVLVLSSE